MILDYHRAISIEEAISLLQRPKLRTLPLGGGTYLSSLDQSDCEVVDLQDLGLDRIEIEGEVLTLGAALNLHTISQIIEIPAGLRKAIRDHRSYNLRQISTLAGELVAADGRSALCAAFLAMDAILKCRPPQVMISLEDVLRHRRTWLLGKIITDVVIPRRVRLVCEAVSRTRADSPILSVAACRWPSGRLRIAVSGFGPLPVVVCDRSVISTDHAPVDFTLPEADDEWATSEYRQAAANVLIQRAIQSLGE